MKTAIGDEERAAVVELLMDASREIETLRRVGEILEAKVEVVAAFEAALRARPRQAARVSGPDITYRLARGVDRMVEGRGRPIDEADDGPGPGADRDAGDRADLDADGAAELEALEAADRAGLDAAVADLADIAEVKGIMRALEMLAAAPPEGGRWSLAESDAVRGMMDICRDRAMAIRLSADAAEETATALERDFEAVCKALGLPWESVWPDDEG